MKKRNSRKDSNELGIVWYLIPALWVAATAAGLLVVTNWPAALTDPLPAQADSLSNAFTAASVSSGDTSVPSASEVFAGRPYEVSQHVDQF